MVALIKLWNRRVLASPDDIAVIAADEQVTYTELDERASVLARLLRARGVGPEILVGVCIDRSVNLVVGLLGILKAGGACVPLDPSCPAERLRHLVADSGVRLVLCDSQEPSSLSGGDVEFFAVDRLRLVAETGRVAPHVHAQNLAYVSYTSDSAGRPRGVAITHASIGTFLRRMAKESGLAAGDRVLDLAPLSFDRSALEIFLPLTVGGCVVFAPAGANTNPELLAAMVKKHGVTMVRASFDNLEVHSEPGGTVPETVDGTTQSMAIGRAHPVAEVVVRGFNPVRHLDRPGFHELEPAARA